MSYENIFFLFLRNEENIKIYNNVRNLTAEKHNYICVSLMAIEEYFFSSRRRAK